MPPCNFDLLPVYNFDEIFLWIMSFIRHHPCFSKRARSIHQKKKKKKKRRSKVKSLEVLEIHAPIQLWFASSLQFWWKISASSIRVLAGMLLATHNIQGVVNHASFCHEDSVLRTKHEVLWWGGTSYLFNLRAHFEILVQLDVGSELHQFDV